MLKIPFFGRIFFVICFSAVFGNLKAQWVSPSILNVGGSTASSGYFSFDWSIGESTAITTLSNANSMLTQGVLQYHSGYVVDKNLAMIWFPNEIRLFPNPVKNFLEIDIKHLIPGDIHLELYNKTGQLLWQKDLDYNGVSRIEKLNMSGMPAGNYTLYIIQDRVPESYSLKKYYKRGAFNIIKIQ